LEAHNNVKVNEWSRFLWSQQKHTKKSSNLEIMFCGFPRMRQFTTTTRRTITTKGAYTRANFKEGFVETIGSEERLQIQST